MIGAKIGSYRIERELGRGGMGAVYVATHALLGRTAAIKVLLPSMSSDEAVQRFFNEARAATAVRHPGIVEVFDYGLADDGSAFIVMELLAGESLANRLRRLGTVSPEFAIAVTRQITSALAAAHRAGIIHRDLKPDNVFVVRDPDVPMGERIKLLDFGIAKLVSADGTFDMALTHTGALMGTPYYMSPEQCRGAAKVDARSDLYSLGCMMFEMVTGRVPFLGAGVGEVIGAHIHVAPAAPRSLVPDLAPELEQLILRLLAKSPEDRPDSADILVDELAALAAGPRSPSRMSDPPPLASGGPPRVVSAAPGDALSLTTNRTASEAASWPAAGERTRRRPLILLGAAALALAAVAIVVLPSRDDGATQVVAGESTGASVLVRPDAESVADAGPPDTGSRVDAASVRRPSEVAGGIDVRDAANPAAEAQRRGSHLRELVRTHACTKARRYARASTTPNRKELLALANQCVEKDAVPPDQPAAADSGPTWPKPDPPKWQATFEFGAVTMSETSAREEIVNDFDTRKPGIRYCYTDRRLSGRRPPNAKVSITITVPLGRAFATATVSGGDPVAAQCVKYVMQGVTWPRLETKEPVIVKTSFTVTIE